MVIQVSKLPTAEERSDFALLMRSSAAANGKSSAGLHSSKIISVTVLEPDEYVRLY